MVAVPAGVTQAALDAEASARATADDLRQLLSGKGAASGYAGLDANAFVPAAQLARWRAGPIAVGPSDAGEVTVISQTIPAGLMGTTGHLRCTLDGDFLNNHASTGRMVTLRVYAGGTKIYDAQSNNLLQSANRRALWGLLDFVNRGAANSNRLAGFVGVGTVTAPTTGFSSFGVGTTLAPVASDIVSVDTAVDWVFKVTLQLSASESTLDARVSQALLEVV